MTRAAAERGRPRAVSHVGIAVHRLDDVLPLYTELLGGVLRGRQRLEDRGLEVAFVDVGGTEIELLEATRPGTAIEKFLATRGEGLHHLAFAVEDAGAALERARAAGLRLIDETPRPGAHGLVAFVHPSATHGVLIEFCGRAEPVQR